MSSQPAQPLLLTYEDYRAVPEDGRRYELLEGELQVGPSPTTTHQRISRNLEFILHAHVKAHDLGEVFDAPVDVILDRGTVVQPDLLFVASARSGIISARAIEGSPDLVVEIMSPGSEGRSRDLGYKRQLYMRHGVAHYWVIDPEARTLAEYVLVDRSYELRGTSLGGQVFTSALFADLPIDLGAVFS